MRILITGSNGLIGGEAVEYFGLQGHEIIGLDNNMRRHFFGVAGDTKWNRNRLIGKVPSYSCYSVDIREAGDVQAVFETKGPFDAVIHCAAQPSHDKAREIPQLDFAVNAVGTLNLLEATRQFSPAAVLIFMSTNKVYGDTPNDMDFKEYPTRYDAHFTSMWQGFSEQTRIDRSTHSVFGASKLAADIMVQEYAHTYGLKTVVLRGGCLTGPNHSGVELHGFLSYLVKTVMTNGRYNVYGYHGKQVRDNIHSRDVVRAMEQIIAAPRPGEVYNIGGGRANSVSIIEAFSIVETMLDTTVSYDYVEQHRLGDHICYITDLGKFTGHYPSWSMTYSLEKIIEEIIEAGR